MLHHIIARESGKIQVKALFLRKRENKRLKSNKKETNGEKLLSIPIFEAMLLMILEQSKENTSTKERCTGRGPGVCGAPFYL